MDKKDKEVLEYNERFIKKVLKAALYTLCVILFAIFLLGLVLGLMLDGSETSIIISLSIAIIFTIFYSSLTIIEEIKKIK